MNSISKQIREYQAMKKKGFKTGMPERRIDVTLDGKIYDTLRKKDRFGNDVLMRVMRMIEPHRAFNEPLDETFKAVDEIQ